MSNLPSVLAERLTISYAQLADFCQRWQIQELALFGSVVRDDFRPDSDIDVLAVYEPDVVRSLFTQVGIKDELAELFGRKVDFVEKRSLKNPFSQREILGCCRIIYPLEAANFVTLTEADPLALETVRNHSALFQMAQVAQESCGFLVGTDYEDFLTDSMLQGAMCRQLGVLGRAAGRLSEGFRRSHAGIDWDDIIEWAAVVAYEPGVAVDLRCVWEISVRRIPLLRDALNEIVPPVPTNEELPLIRLK